jgi:hypothetical protein
MDTLGLFCKTGGQVPVMAVEWSATKKTAVEAQIQGKDSRKTYGKDQIWPH